jgi:hypothetical protein
MLRTEAIDALVEKLRLDYGCAVACILPENLSVRADLAETGMYDAAYDRGYVSLGD